MLEGLIIILFIAAVVFLVAGICKNPKHKKTKLHQNARPVSDQKDVRTIEQEIKIPPEGVIQQKISNLPKAKIRKIIDGDTFFAISDRRYAKIRLDSIDCPEDGQPWGDIAKFGLVKFVGGKTVHLEEHGLDIYDRILATVYVWDEKNNLWLNVNERMVILGHAWVMRAFYDHLPKDRQEKLNRLEGWARSKKVGLWKTPNPIPPWKWRKEIM